MKRYSITTKEIAMDDRKIVSGILSGDEKALRFFYRHFAPRLTTFIKNKIGSKEDAEEILQDTLLATIDGFRDFAFRSSIFTFICSIANHKIIDFYRKKKIKKILFSQMPEVETLVSAILGPEEVLDEELLKSKIKSTFRLLTPTYQKMLQLKYIYGYSVEEIASMLSISFKSAESQLFRARKAFVAAYTS